MSSLNPIETTDSKAYPALFCFSEDRKRDIIQHASSYKGMTVERTKQIVQCMLSAQHAPRLLLFEVDSTTRYHS